MPLLRSMAFHWRLIALDSLKPVSSINRSITRLRYPLRYRGFGCARSLLVPLQSGLPEYSFSCSPSQQSVVCTFYGLYHSACKARALGATRSGLIHKRGSRGSPFLWSQKTLDLGLSPSLSTRLWRTRGIAAFSDDRWLLVRPMRPPGSPLRRRPNLRSSCELCILSAESEVEPHPKGRTNTGWGRVRDDGNPKLTEGRERRLADRDLYPH